MQEKEHTEDRELRGFPETLDGVYPGEARERGSLTVAEAGRRGGTACKEQHGTVHYIKMGRKGGGATKERYGMEFYAQIGKKGGTSTFLSHGPDFYKTIGKKGGARVAELIRRGREIEAGEGGS